MKNKNLLKKLAGIFFCIFCLQKTITALIVGSNTLPSVEGNQTFLAADSASVLLPNEARAFGFLKSGFSLQDSTTTATFKSAFPVSGDVALNGGRLFLDTDLVCQNPARLTSGGYIFGAQHALEFSESTTWISATRNMVLERVKLYLNSDLTISGTLRIRGNCLIDGRWNNFKLDPRAMILVDHNSTLELRNLELGCVSGYQVRCLNDSGKIILDNMRLVQDGNFSFTSGSIMFCNDVNFVGPYTFNYASKLTSTIDTDSTWHLSDVVKLSIGRKNGIFSREPLYFTDNSSVLRMENCTLSITSSGMRLTRGTVLVDGEVKFEMNSTSSTNGLLLGNGTATDDTALKFYPGAVMNFTRGHFVNDIAQTNNFLTGDVSEKFVRQASGTYFYTNQNIYFTNVDIKSEPTSLTLAQTGKKLTFYNCLLSSSLADFYLTGTRQSESTYLLDSGGQIFLLKGSLPAAINVHGQGNSLRGVGDFTGPITLMNGAADVTMSFDGTVFNDIAMNGGKVILGKNTKLGKDVVLTGSGTVNLSTYDIGLRLKDKVWTSTIFWDGNSATVNLRADQILTSQMTFSGTCIFDGNGNEFTLASAGKIVVDKYATLRLQNLTLKNISGNNVSCISNAGTIIFDNVKMVPSADFSFTKGSFSVFNQMDFSGSYSFFYQSTMTSTVGSNSTLKISNGATLSIGRKNSVYAREPLYFREASSALNFDGSSFNVTANGMRLMTGTLMVNKQMIADIRSTSSTNGLILGNGDAANDTKCLWGPSAAVLFRRGHLTYEVTDPVKFQPKVSGAKISLSNGVSLYVNEDLTFQNIGIDVTSLAWNLVIKSGKTLRYDNATFLLPGIQFNATGKRYDIVTTLLDGNSSLLSFAGVIPMYTLVSGTGNSIGGFGGIGAGVILLNNQTALDIGVAGGMLDNVVLNGGSVSLSKSLVFADNKLFTTNGKVSMPNRSVSIGGQDLLSTSSIFWDSSSSYIVLRSNLKLCSRWTFSGNCTIFGVNNSIVFGPGGQILLERGARLTFKSVTLSGIEDGQICCVNNGGKIIFDSALWLQDSNFSFTLGSFDVENKFSMQAPTSIFSYKSSQQSLVTSRSEFEIRQDSIFSYEPATASRSLVALQDSTSKITLIDAALQSTSTGIQLTKGSLEIRGNSTLSSAASYKTEGIMFGDGISSSNNLKIDIFHDATLDLISGYVVYKNVA